MGYMDLIAILQSLPQDRQSEVFDFVEFIAVKSGVAIEKPLVHQTWTDAEFSELAMRQALRGMENEAVSYTHADLKAAVA
ncbi:MAG: hypothetical protein PHU06_10610 [Gallionella sp.]|nr:hypothetical protein [Gallionella sp.]MDD4959538.1 hypothetical protein [Gallionella sp.]